MTFDPKRLTQHPLDYAPGDDADMHPLDHHDQRMFDPPFGSRTVAWAVVIFWVVVAGAIALMN